jgi:casein kinase 1
MNRLISIHS